MYLSQLCFQYDATNPLQNIIEDTFISKDISLGLSEFRVYSMSDTLNNVLKITFTQLKFFKLQVD